MEWFSYDSFGWGGFEIAMWWSSAIIYIDTFMVAFMGKKGYTINR